ncbi:MAG TPA: DUF5666 domain-containing protein [bacterium]|nr:DUF5666 domain-containing protein [bacterium]
MQKARFYPIVIALIAVLAAGFTFVSVKRHASAQTQPPAQGGQHRGSRVFGTIQSVSTGSLVVTGRDGTSYTVKTTTATKVLTQAAARITEIKAGDMVRVVAQKSADGSLTAEAVRAAPAGLGSAGPGRGGVRDSGSGRVFVAGLVAGATGSSLSVASSAGAATTVAVPASARISKLTAVPVASLAAGAHVAAMGTLNADGSFSATTIMVLTARR